MTTKQVQLLLLYLGYDVGTVDGICGKQTQAAVKQFQADFGGIGVDGISGEETQKALKYAVAYETLKRETTEASAAVGGGSNVPTKTGTFWDEIEYFERKEFRCPCGKCGGFPVEPQETLVRTVDQMRKDFGTAIIIVPEDGHSGGSGVRCQAYNDSLSGSVKNSKHVQGKAVDFKAPGKSTLEVESYITKLKTAGTIRYWYRISAGSWHMDIL